MKRDARNTNIAIIAFVITLVVSISCTTMAEIQGTIDIAHEGYGANSAALIWGGGLSAYDGSAGVSILEKSAGSGQGNLWNDGPIAGFCIELSEWSSSHMGTYNVVFPEQAQNPTTFLGEAIGSVKADYISELWGRFYDPAWAQGDSFTTSQNRDAGAFGAAIWEIIYEDLPSSSSGWDVGADGTAGQLGFKAVGVDSCTANTWLRSLDGQGPRADLRAFTYDGRQDFVVQVPEPATIFLLGMGSVTLIRRRIRAAQ